MIDDKEILTPSDLDYKLKNKQRIYVDTIRKTLKALNMNWIGKKPVLLERLKQHYNSIDYYRKYEKTIILVQNKFRMKYATKCVNDEDFFTLDKFIEIEPIFFYSYIDNENFRYGFDIRSLKKLLSNSNINPYNRRPISEKTIKSIKNRIIFIEKKQISTIIETPMQLSEEQVIRNKVLNVFEKIDSLNILSFGSNVNWFLNLSFSYIKKLYRCLEDIWNYRVQINMEQKCKIVPNNDIFKYQLNYIINLYPQEKNILSKIVLEEMNKLVSSGIDAESRRTGGYYVLIALTEVSYECASSIPWLAQSNY
jgi:hypothetical protein